MRNCITTLAAALHLFATTSMGIFLASLARFRKTIRQMA